MEINSRNIDSREQPYLIAEIGVNYFDIAEKEEIPPLEAAKKMVSKAATAGADAVKFQSYSADQLASKQSPAYWDTSEESAKNQYELFSQYDDFGADEFEEISKWTTDNHEIDFLSTPFDFHAVDYLEELVPAYKIASADITNHPLLRYVANKGKPILLSTGASTVGEIDNAVRVIEEEAPDIELCLLHCVLQYPTEQDNANLGMIEHLHRLYPEYTVGYSDHVPPDDSMITLLNSVVKGAKVIEKHFTLDKSLEGNDHYHAMDPKDIQTFRRNINRLNATTGISRKAPIDAEVESRKHARRSLVAARTIEEGEEISQNDLAIKRPGTGISPTMLNIILGQTAAQTIEADEIITWESL
ncbi:N-acetylneuraminate synthase protein [Halorhabdus tiamatea SARL4B]|uniref:N-acetyl neuramic acid synthetase NeuB n=1 Tax=Halorhabdus tiamatea SARL4B TaxID=1033806 RepID=F7PGC3_9EURY|nr:N-acetylneuraminate synthase family protein [Halorhabdus tiamatea]ERJ05395.1 N-acetylneuraminate synthase protein [Halorhabdus tiamatea SARL4B]CCQ33133.1 N-acetyl neuramic acid synthetase NeuB [Halorhabdus tiamatea SARL4B]